MVKEDIDRLLEAGFIYPVVNSEWVSPIVVVPKKVGADVKTKIRVCQESLTPQQRRITSQYPLQT